MRRGLVAAMEGECEVIVAPFQDGEPIADTLEVESIEHVIDVNQKEMDDVSNVMSALESIFDVVSLAATNGGFRKENAHVVNVSLEYMYDKLGMPSSNLFALESLANEHSRVAATTLALESLTEAIKKAWEFVINAIKKAFEWIANLYNKIFSSVKSLNTKAKELKETLNNNKDELSKTSFKDSALAKALCIDGVVPTDLSSSLKLVVKYLDVSVALTIKNATLFKGMSKSYYDFDSNSYDIQKLEEFKLNPMHVDTDRVISNPEKYGFDLKDKPNLKLMLNQQMPGNKTMLSVINDKLLVGKEAFDVIDQIVMKVGNFSEDNAIKSDEVPGLDRSHALDVVDAVIELTNAVLAYQSQEKTVNSIKKEFLNDAERFKNVRGDSPNSSEHFKNLQKLTKYIARMLDQPIASMCSYSEKTSRALLQYVTKSMKMPAQA